MKKGADIESKFYKVLSTEGASEATILLYDYIGEYYEWDDEKGWEKGGVTAQGFAEELNRLAAQYPVIHLRINSAGGDFFHGNAILTAIQNCKSEVHTWNDGMAASMAADIWMCGHRRHMAKNALMMIHPAWGICAGNAQDLREYADVTDKISEAAIIATAASTGIGEDEMRARYYADYKDHWLTYNDAVKDGLVNETGEYDAADLPGDVEKMTYKQLLDHFHKSQHPDAQGLAERLKNLWEKTIATFSNKSVSPAAAPAKAGANTTDMTLDELKKSLKEGTLQAADVQAYLDELNGAANATTTEADNSEAAIAEMRKDLDAALTANANLAAQMKTVQDKLAEYGKLPGASKAAPGMPDGDPPIGEGDDPTKALDSFNKAVAESAKVHGNPFKRQGEL